MGKSRVIIENVPRNFLIIPVLFVAHIFYQIGVGYWLFELAGGVRESPNGGWTRLGGIDWAFGIPLSIPSNYLSTITNIGPCTWESGGWSLILMFGAWLLTAIATGQLIQKMVNREPRKFGKFYWRLLVVILGWVFVPVPVEMTMAYGFTVLC